MSGGMGYYNGDIFDEDGNPIDPNALGMQQEPRQGNPLRDHLKKVEEQNKTLQEQVAQLVAAQRRNAVADELQAKGYDRGVASLYDGDPAKLDEWLTQVSPFLAKTPTDTSATGAAQGMGGAGGSTVPAEGQAALQQLQQMGQGAAAPQGTEAEQIAQMRNAQSPEELMKLLNANGNPYYWQG